MMKYIILFIVITSCTKKFEVQEGNGVLYFKDFTSEIQDLKVIEWKVGREKEKTISQGIRFITSIPRLTSDSVKKLQAKDGIDAFIFRVSHTHRGQTKSLGHITMPFNNISRTADNFTITLYYAAAAISQKFRSFHCPAFGHRLKIDDHELSSGQKSIRSNLYIRPGKRVMQKVHRVSFVPQSFNAGVKMRGKYHMDIAFYSDKKKKIFSQWQPIKGEIEISEERSVSVQSCIGIKEEVKALPESRLPTLNDLQIR